LTIQAMRGPASAICTTPPPVLVESASQVPAPLISQPACVKTFQTKTLLQGFDGFAPTS
jgi:hypothetical protein